MYGSVFMLNNLKEQAYSAASEIIEVAGLKKGQILVVGCSTSEILGSRIGTDSSPDTAKEVFDGIYCAAQEKGIFLEMCPTSNRQTHAIEDMTNYPFMDYLNEGIKVTLNTDDMAIEGITLAKEYDYMKKEYGLSFEQERIILKNAIAAAFTSNTVKNKLKKELNLE